MAKVLKTAAMVVGGITLAVGTFGVGAGLAAGWTLAASVSAVATTASLGAAFAAAAALEAAGSLLEKKPSAPANPMEWKADPQAGIPYPMGEGYVGGQIIYRQAYGDKNKYQTCISIHGGGGPHEAFQHLYVDNIIRSIGANGAVNIPDAGYMYAATQLGRTPEPSNLNVAPIDPYAWTGDCKLSGYAASIITMKYDGKGKHTLTSTPQIGWYGRWARVYDPRKDSTYPGGSGAHRSNDESTWEWSANPYLHALTWLIGRRAPNGMLIVGVGCSLKNVIVSQFVEGANIADANGWTMFGVAMSTDDKWDTLKKILQAGSAVPMRLGGQIGCIINTPRVSLATITVDDIIGDISVQATSSRKDRINSIVPRYLGKQSVTTQDSDGNLVTSDTFAILPAAPIVIDNYVAFDGKKRQREVEYSFVQSFDPDLKQVGQLARYDLENAREFGPISLPLRLRWMGYRPGDVVTVTVAEAGLQAQDILLLNRQLDPQTGTVTMTARSETSAKHAFALGQTAVPAETPGVAIPDLGAASPSPGDWTVTGTTLTSATGAIPALELALRAQTADEIADGDPVVDPTVTMIVVSYRTIPILLAEDGTPLLDETGAPMFNEAAVPGDWKSGGVFPPSMTLTDITQGIVPGTAYQIGIAYASRAGTSDMVIVGTAVAGDLATSRGAFIIRSRTVDYPVTTDSSSISIVAFNGVLDDGRSIAFPASSVTGLSSSTSYGLFFRIADRTYIATLAPSEAEMASNAYVFLDWWTTSDATGVYPTSPTPPGGSGGGGSHPALP